MEATGITEGQTEQAACHKLGVVGIVGVVGVVGVGKRDAGVCHNPRWTSQRAAGHGTPYSIDNAGISDC